MVSHGISWVSTGLARKCLGLQCMFIICSRFGCVGFVAAKRNLISSCNELAKYAVAPGFSGRPWRDQGLGVEISGQIGVEGKISARWPVSRVLSLDPRFAPWAHWMTIPLGCTLLRTSTRPTRTTARKPAFRQDRSPSNGRPYLVLLQVGFALPPLLPAARCALTAPFHPYQQKLAVCFLWHFP